MERRHFNRVPFCTHASIVVGSEQWETEILDLSLKGALLHHPSEARLTINMDMALSFNLDGLDKPISMQGKVSHIEAEQIGFHCISMEIDSATELRRLMELNLSDASLLQRDLAALLLTHK